MFLFNLVKAQQLSLFGVPGGRSGAATGRPSTHLEPVEVKAHTRHTEHGAVEVPAHTRMVLRTSAPTPAPAHRTSAAEAPAPESGKPFDPMSYTMTELQDLVKLSGDAQKREAAQAELARRSAAHPSVVRQQAVADARKRLHAQNAEAAALMEHPGVTASAKKRIEAEMHDSRAIENPYRTSADLHDMAEHFDSVLKPHREAAAAHEGREAQIQAARDLFNEIVQLEDQEGQYNEVGRRAPAAVKQKLQAAIAKHAALPKDIVSEAMKRDRADQDKKDAENAAQLKAREAERQQAHYDSIRAKEQERAKAVAEQRAKEEAPPATAPEPAPAPADTSSHYQDLRAQHDAEIRAMADRSKEQAAPAKPKAPRKKAEPERADNPREDTPPGVTKGAQKLVREIEKMVDENSAEFREAGGWSKQRDRIDRYLTKLRREGDDSPTSDWLSNQRQRIGAKHENAEAWRRMARNAPVGMEPADYGISLLARGKAMEFSLLPKEVQDQAIQKRNAQTWTPGVHELNLPHYGRVKVEVKKMGNRAYQHPRNQYATTISWRDHAGNFSSATFDPFDHTDSRERWKSERGSSPGELLAYEVNKAMEGKAPLPPVSDEINETNKLDWLPYVYSNRK